VKCIQVILITGFVTRLTRRVPLVEQELPTLPDHLSSPPVFSGVRVTRSLVLCVCFADRCLSFCTFSFGHCVVCSSSIYRFLLPLWYLQTLPHLWIYAEMLFTDMNCVTFGLTIGKCDWHLTCNVSSECSVPHFTDTFDEPFVQRYLLILNFRRTNGIQIKTKQHCVDFGFTVAI
jgi:hypothetical protein